MQYYAIRQFSQFIKRCFKWHSNQGNWYALFFVGFLFIYVSMISSFLCFSSKRTGTDGRYHLESPIHTLDFSLCKVVLLKSVHPIQTQSIHIQKNPHLKYFPRTGNTEGFLACFPGKKKKKKVQLLSISSILKIFTSSL